MSVREELAGALLECLRDVAALLDTAHDAAVQQQDALVRSDAEAITATCIAQDDILRRIAQTDERAASVAAKIAAEAGLDQTAADTHAIAQAAGAPYTALIMREFSRISLTSQMVHDANEINSRLLKNGLDIITSCLRIIVREPQPMVYSQKASLTGSGSGVLSLDSKV